MPTTVIRIVGIRIECQLANLRPQMGGLVMSERNWSVVPASTAGRFLHHMVDIFCRLLALSSKMPHNRAIGGAPAMGHDILACPQFGHNTSMSIRILGSFHRGNLQTDPSSAVILPIC